MFVVILGILLSCKPIEYAPGDSLLCGRLVVPAMTLQSDLEIVDFAACISCIWLYGCWHLQSLCTHLNISFDIKPMICCLNFSGWCHLPSCRICKHFWNDGVVILQPMTSSLYDIFCRHNCPACGWWQGQANTINYDKDAYTVVHKLHAINPIILCNPRNTTNIIL